MRNNKSKRIISGVLALSTLLSTTGGIGFTVTAEEPVENKEESITKTVQDASDYLQTLCAEYGTPSIMISEGDTVYINDEKVATTVVPVTRKLIDDQEKIKAQYWLASGYYKDFATLKADAEKLEQYLQKDRASVTSSEQALKTVLVSIRDWCITNKLSSGTGVFNNKDTDGLAQNVYKYIEKNAEDSLLNLTATVPEDELTEELTKYLQAYVYTEDGSILNSCKDGKRLDMRMYVLNTLTKMHNAYTNIGNSIETLVGDTAISSEEYITQHLQDKTLEELGLAYAGLITNIELVDTYYYNLAEAVIDVYVGEDELLGQMTASEYMNFMTAYSWVKEDGTIDTTYAETANIIAEIVANKDKWCFDNSRLESAKSTLNPAFTVQYAEGISTDKGYIERTEVATSETETINASADEPLTIVEGVELKVLKTTKLKAIAEIPTDLLMVYAMVYDMNGTYDDVLTGGIDIDKFESYFEDKQNTLSGEWDYNATQYSAIKYVTTETTETENVEYKKESLKNPDGSERKYSRQSEVTPWMNLGYFLDDYGTETADDYTEYKETIKTRYSNLFEWERYRNEGDNNSIVENSLNPWHPAEYTGTISTDMSTMLKENGYKVTSDTKFKNNTLLITVDRYALDSKGSDAKGIVKYGIDFTDKDYKDFRYKMDIMFLMDLIRQAEYESILPSQMEEIESFIAFMGIEDVTTQEALKEAYKHYVTGYNQHNGYAITLNYLYEASIELDETTDKYPSENKKVLLTEIPEYAISEYYEDNQDLLTVEDIVSEDFKTDKAFKESLSELSENSDKLLNSDTEPFDIQISDSNWELQLEKYATNGSLTQYGKKATIPLGYTANVDAYVPLSNRIMDTRYFVKYIPYSSNVLPTSTNTNYYAVDLNNNVRNTIETMAAVSSHGAPGFKAWTDADLSELYGENGLLKVFYAQDRGSYFVKTLQRVMLPVNQFTTTGSSIANVNKGLKVNDTFGNNNGYQNAAEGLGVSVSAEDLPELVWDDITGGVVNNSTYYNKDTTGKNVYGGDVHLWVSKSTAEDGILIADWVNPVPDVLKGAIESTKAKTGVYNNDLENTMLSKEKDTRIKTGDKITISSCKTSGTYADWAFKKQLVTADYYYCSNCGVLIDSPQNHCYYHWSEHHSYSYQVPVKGPVEDAGYKPIPKGIDPGGNAYTSTKDWEKKKDYSNDKNCNTTLGNVTNSTDPSFDHEQTVADAVEKAQKAGNSQQIPNTDGSISIIAKDLAEALELANKYPKGTTIHMYYEATNPDTGKKKAVASHATSDGSGAPPDPEPPKYETVTVSYNIPKETQICDPSGIKALTVWQVELGSSPFETRVGNGNNEATYFMQPEVESAYRTIINIRNDQKPSNSNDIAAKRNYETTLRNAIKAFFTVWKGGWPDYLKDEFSSFRMSDTFSPELAFVTNTNQLDPIVEACGIGYPPTGQEVTNSSMLTLPNPRNWGVIKSVNGLYGVEVLGDMTENYRNSTDGISVTENRDYTSQNDVVWNVVERFGKELPISADTLYKYVDNLFKRSTPVVDESEQDKGEVTVKDGFNPTTSSVLSKYYRPYYFGTGTGNVNAMIVTDKDKETFADVTNNTPGGTNGKATIKLPDLTYVPYTIINNIDKVTKSGQDLDYTINGTVKNVTHDIFGTELKSNTFRAEVYDSIFKANIVPEVLMTYKNSYLKVDGSLADYADRGKADSVYIAGYNKYAMDLPMYNKAELTYNVTGDSFKTTGAATAKSTNAKKLGGTHDVLYTGTEVSTVVDSSIKPEMSFTSWVIDFEDENESVGSTWNENYNSSTAYNQVQSWLNTYKGSGADNNGKFEYNMTLSTTFNTSAIYEKTSNSKETKTSSTLRVNNNREMKPIEVTNTYNYTLNGKTMYDTKPTLKCSVTVRNGRLATVTVDGTTYVLYSPTVGRMANTAGFKNLKEEHYEVAEAIVNMKLEEFAATLTHNGGDQKWTTYSDKSIFTDNSGTTITNVVGDEKAVYDANYANVSGWYGEDTTVLTLNCYKLNGVIDNAHAFTYKIPIDYGYKSPTNKKDLFKAGSAIYAYNELRMEYPNTAKITDKQVVSGMYDIIGDEGTDVLKNTPAVAYVISNATVNDMTR